MTVITRFVRRQILRPWAASAIHGLGKANPLATFPPPWAQSQALVTHFVCPKDSGTGLDRAVRKGKETDPNQTQT